MSPTFRMAGTDQSSSGGIDQLFKDATKSIEDAETVMSKTQASIEKEKASKNGRNKVVSKASEIVNVLLEPASQVANLLNGLGGMFAPCGVAGNVLQTIVDLESGRRENDARISVVFLDMSRTLVILGTLKPGFENIHTLVAPLKVFLDRIVGTMKRFGQFSVAYHEAKSLKSTLKHLIHSKGNKEKLSEFHMELENYKKELNILISQQTLLVVSASADSLKRIESKLDKVYGFYASLSDENEIQATEFIERCGGIERVQNDDTLLDELASRLNVSITPNIRRAVKESFEEMLKQSYASFNLQFRFAFEQRIEYSRELIMNELKSGPYELISDPDLKQIWKNIAAKESSVKRRQFIDAMVYYFNVQWKTYKVNHNADREDAWTKAIISKVHYHPAIGDAIDDDASGYISVEELNDFLRKKPKDWSVPQWIAYWAYGWDADNIFYQEKILKSYKQLESLRDKSGPNSDRIKNYLEKTQDPIKIIVGSVYTMESLGSAAETKMNKLRLEWRSQVENTIKTHLKSVNLKIEYSSLSAICGSERIEATTLPLISLILSLHVPKLSQASVSDEDVEEAINCIQTVLDVVLDRISDLRLIWRRQRTDVDVQFRYYANGLLQDYYKKKYDDLQTDSGDDDLSSWDSEDEWSSEDGADHKSHEVEVNQPSTAPGLSRALPSGRGEAYENPNRSPSREPADQIQHYQGLASTPTQLPTFTQGDSEEYAGAYTGGQSYNEHGGSYLIGHELNVPPAREGEEETAYIYEGRDREEVGGNEEGIGEEGKAADDNEGEEYGAAGNYEEEEEEEEGDDGDDDDE